MSIDTLHRLLMGLTAATGIIFLLVMLRGALVPMQASVQADRWLRVFWGLLIALVIECVGLVLFATF